MSAPKEFHINEKWVSHVTQMPGKSKKSEFIKACNDLYTSQWLVLEFCEVNNEKKKKEEDEILEDWTFMLAAAESSRYISPFLHNSVAKSRSFVDNVLPNLDDARFQQITRVSRSTFKYIIDIIKDDEVFEGAKIGKQYPIEMQLCLVLYRLGSSGEGATFTKIASIFGVGDGGTIQNMTKRFYKAILKHKNRFLFWPNPSERKQIREDTYFELPYCIGYVDGTEIKLAEKPCEDPESYFSRKHMYSIKVQCVCDYQLRIRHLVVGYPGSVHDARIFNNCDLSKNPENFFNDNEWIAGDSAYKITPTVLTPFRTNTTSDNEQTRKRFNKKFSRYRIRIEHCFGLLKERFGSLKELRLRIHNDDSLRYACEWVMVCAILHNISIQQKEDFDISLFDFNLINPEEMEMEHQNIYTTHEGEQKRREIIQLMEQNQF